jgi:hypothetical protein
MLHRGTASECTGFAKDTKHDDVACKGKAGVNYVPAEPPPTRKTVGHELLVVFDVVHLFIVEGADHIALCKAAKSDNRLARGDSDLTYETSLVSRRARFLQIEAG